jgi:hypothetical protein
MTNPINEIIARKQLAIKAAEKEFHGLIYGSFFTRRLKGHERLCLSQMRNGRQRQVYISARHAAQVAGGVRRFERLMELIREISVLNLELIKLGEDIADDREPG